MGLHSNGRLLALPEYIRLVWQQLTVTNTLAYYDIEIVTRVKSFTFQEPDLISKFFFSKIEIEN